MMLIIKVNDPQPVGCPTCKSKEGYQYSDLLRLTYTSFHNENGQYEGGQYADFTRVLNKGKSCFCRNCGTRLPFKLESTHTEEV